MSTPSQGQAPVTRIALTGAAGHIATRLRPRLLADGARLRLLDIRRPEGLDAREEFVEADLADAGAIRAALEGVDAVVHMGGISVEADLDAILSANVRGLYNLYEAARANGVPRVVFASSNHATGFYPRAQTVSPHDGMRPDSRYGLSKGWGELVAGFFYDTAGIRTLSIRIGNAGDRPVSPRTAAIWISIDDLAQFVRIGLTHPDIAAATVYGMSRTDAGWWRDPVAERLGYRPKDSAADHGPMPDPVNEGPVSAFFQGGGFCEGDSDGTVRRRDADGLVIEAGAAR